MNFKNILFSFFILFSITGKGQRDIDSLNAIIHKAASDTAVAKAYVDLTEIIGYANPDTVIPLCEKALVIVKNHPSFSGKTEKRAFLRTKANALNNIGLIYMNKGDVSLALDYFHQCLNIMEDNADKPGIVLCLNNIGGLYRNQGDDIQALDYYLRALKMAREIGDKDGTAYSLGNIGVIYGNKKYYDRSLDCYKKSLKIREEIGDKQGTAMSLNNIGEMYYHKKQDSLALSYFNQSLDKWKELGDIDGVSYTLSNIGRVYFNENNYRKALEYAKQSYEYSKKTNFPEDIRDAANLLSSIYRKQSQWKDALEMQDLYIRMKDSVSNAETKKAAVKKQLQYQYDTEKLALEKEQEKKDVVRKVEKQRQKLITYLVIGVLLMVMIFSLFLYNRFRVTAKQKGIIEDQKHIVEEKQKEIIDSIHYAQRIQSTLLAGSEILERQLNDYFVLFRPKDIVSGDFYWCTEKDDCFYLAVCDSTGHGVPGAFMSLLNVSFLNEAINEKNITSLGEVLNYVRQRLITSVSQDGGQDGMDGILLKIEKKNGTKIISYAAAYNAPVLIRNNQALPLSADKMPIGKGEKINSFSTFSMDVQKGDALYLYTDGFADQFGGPRGKKFLYKQLHEKLRSIREFPAIKQKEALDLAFMEWKGELEQVDDLCVVGILL